MKKAVKTPVKAGKARVTKALPSTDFNEKKAVHLKEEKPKASVKTALEGVTESPKSEVSTKYVPKKGDVVNVYDHGKQTFKVTAVRPDGSVDLRGSERLHFAGLSTKKVTLALK